jgi:hypothetical protein
MAEGPPRLLGIVALPGIAGRNLARYDRASRILTTGNKIKFRELRHAPARLMLVGELSTNEGTTLGRFALFLIKRQHGCCWRRIENATRRKRSNC